MIAPASIARPREAGVTTGKKANVGSLERQLSVVGGAALALYGITRGSLAGLGLALAGAALVQRGSTGYCALYNSLGLDTARHNPNAAVPARAGERVECGIVISRPPSQLFKWWRKLENLPQVFSHIESVAETDDRQSHWVAKGPLGVQVEWDAEILNERENEMIAWRSVEGSEVETAGSVHFEKVPGGTEVRVSLKYNPPGGDIGIAAAKVMGDDAEQILQEDLEHFKELMEEQRPTARQGGRSRSSRKK